jgi:hypothetical protein
MVAAGVTPDGKAPAVGAVGSAAFAVFMLALGNTAAIIKSAKMAVAVLKLICFIHFSPFYVPFLFAMFRV